MTVRQPYIYGINEVQVSNVELYEGHDCSYCSIGKLYANADTLAGVPSIWGFADEEYFYSGDLGCGYLFDLVNSVEIGSNRLIFVTIQTDSIVGPLSVYETFLETDNFQIPNYQTRIVDLNSRLNSPFICESDDPKFVWVISSDILGASTENVFKYYPNAGIYIDSYTINTDSRIFGENVDDKIILLSCNQTINKLKTESRSASGFGVITTQTLSSSGVFTTDIKRAFYKIPGYSNWIIHIVDDLYSTTWKLPQLLEIDSAGVSTVSTLTTGGGIKEVLNIQEIDSSYYGIIQENNILSCSKDSNISGLFTSAGDCFDISLSGSPSWNQAFIKKYDGELFLLTTREDEEIFQLFKIDFSEPEYYSNPENLDNSTFINFFTSACPSSGHVDKILLGSDNIQMVRSLQKDSNDLGNLLTFNIAGKKNTIGLPSSSIFYPALIQTKGKNFFVENILSNVGNLQKQAFSKFTLNFLQTYFVRVKDRINEILNSRIENYTPDTTGGLSIATKSSSDQLWICFNFSGVIFITKKNRQDYHGMSKYYHYKNSKIVSLTEEFFAIGAGEQARITYNKLTDEIVLTYFMNDICIGRSWSFNEDPVTYFTFRRTEPGLMDLSAIDRISSAVKGNISPCPANMSDSNFHLTSKSVRHFNVEDVKELYENFNITYTINLHPTIVGGQTRYHFYRSINTSNSRDNMIRFIKFEYYYKVDEAPNGTLFDDQEIYRPAGINDPGLNHYKKIFVDPVENEVKVINNADPAEDVCFFAFDIVPPGGTAPYTNKKLYVKPFFGIFSDITLAGMVDIIEGTIFDTGIILGSKTDKEITGYQKGTHSAIDSGTILSFDSTGQEYSISAGINNSYKAFNLPLTITNVGLTPAKTINIQFSSMGSSVDYKILSYTVKTVF